MNDVVTNSNTQSSPIVPPWQGGAINAYGATDVGMVRDSNQDSYCVEEKTGVYLVADGMGGRAGGEVASMLAVSAIAQEVKSRIDTLTGRDLSARRALLAQAVNTASLRIYERSLELPQYRGMGTTATLLWIPPVHLQSKRHASTAIIAHVGDSRCYLMRAGFLYQLTDDHSLVNEQMKTGVMLQSDPMATQMKNVITRCVGYQEEEEVDTLAVPLFSKDRFLICSDGLTNKVSDEEILRFLSEPNLEDVPARLIEQANAAGGDDNITVVIVELD